MSRACLAASFFLVLIWSVGCGKPVDKGPQLAKVTGTVKMDGKAVPTGEIHFGVPGFPPRALDIKDGKYEGEAPIGKNEVQVFIYVEGPPVKKYEGQRDKRNTTPEKYWGPNSVLSANVEAGGANEFNFNLASK